MTDRGDGGAWPSLPPTRAGWTRVAGTLLSARRMPATAAVVAWSLPAAYAGAFYTAWGAAWAVLGSAPRPNIDDPVSISVLVDIPYFAAGVMLVGLPIWVLGGAGVVAWHAQTNGRSRLTAFVRVLLLWLLWAAAFASVRANTSLVDWYMD
jgi:hypothetical protein